MSVTATSQPRRPPEGITCSDWQPREEGKKACAFVMKGEGGFLCSKGEHFLCMEWAKANQHLVPSTALVWGKRNESAHIASNDQSPPSPTPTTPQAELFALTPPPAPQPLPKPNVEPTRPQTSTTHAADLLLGKPMPYRPAKEIPGQDLEALEALGVEIKLSAKNLPDTWIVAKKTGRTDRFELTFRELATIRLLVDAFPGSKVTGLGLPPHLEHILSPQGTPQ